MKTKLVRIGDSKAVIIPFRLLKLSGPGEKVRIDVEENKIVITSTKRKAREGWEELIRNEVKKTGNRID